MRRAISETYGQENHGKIDAIVAMNLLKSHGTREQHFHPAKANMKMLCVHASGRTCPSQTTGSMVVALYPDQRDVYWFTLY